MHTIASNLYYQGMLLERHLSTCRPSHLFSAKHKSQCLQVTASTRAGALRVFKPPLIFHCPICSPHFLLVIATFERVSNSGVNPKAETSALSSDQSPQAFAVQVRKSVYAFMSSLEI